MSGETLLTEVRCEELPPAQVWALARDFPDLLLAALRKAGFADDNSRRACDANGDPLWLATPRRFAALIDGVLPTSPAARVFRRGPAVADCRDANGEPTAALIGFMRAVGASCERDLVHVSEKDREHVAWRGERAGEALANAAPGLIAAVLRNVNAPRLMRWGDNEFKFIRPPRGLLMMLGDAAIAPPATVLGAPMTADTTGHPTLSDGRIALARAGDYAQTLESDGKIVVDIRRRRAIIAAAIPNAEKKAALLDEVAAMCEHPAPYEGEMDSAFSRLPPFCVEECLGKRQRAFPVFINGRLTNKYWFVADNIPPDPAPMIADFNAVSRAGLRDMAFYLNEDKKLSLESALDRLSAIAYHRKLGSQRQRADRLAVIANGIADCLRLTDEEKRLLNKAARICKSDLSTLMVGEYPALEGLMAAEYFADDDVAPIVRCHNNRHPWRRESPSIVGNKPAAALALANHLEKLVAMFAVGEPPSGNKDPRGLRAAAATVAAIQQKTNLPLGDLIAVAIGAFDDPPTAIAEDVREFIIERVRHYLLADGMPADILNAALATKPERIGDIEKMAKALAEFAPTPAAAGLIDANKRIGNILRKSGGQTTALAEPDPALMTAPVELALFKALEICQKNNATTLQNGDFAAALENLAALKPAVDDFFAHVMVNADDPATRANRFTLLAALRRQLGAVGDLSKLSAR